MSQLSIYFLSPGRQSILIVVGAERHQETKSDLKGDKGLDSRRPPMPQCGKTTGQSNTAPGWEGMKGLRIKDGG